MPKLRSVLYAAVALSMVLFATGSQAEVVYSEDFTGGANSFTINNSGDPGNVGWAYDTACASSQAAGHSDPDNLRWGSFTDCLNYGPGPGHTDTATSASNDLPDGCTLNFNYLLDFQEGPTFDNANVTIAGGGAELATFANGDLVSSATWTAHSVGLPSGSVAIDFIGDTPDFTLNTGAGFQIDDVAIDCPAPPTPATSGWGVFALMMGISVAMAAALFRLRRQSEVRGL